MAKLEIKKDLQFAEQVQEETEKCTPELSLRHHKSLNKTNLLRFFVLSSMSFELNNRLGALSASGKRCQLRSLSVRRVGGSQEIIQGTKLCT